MPKPNAFIEPVDHLSAGHGLHEVALDTRRYFLPHSRHIPDEVKRELEKTRHLGCDHLDEETGRRCGSKHFLQLDHIHEYSRGGSNEAHNLRWMCGFHNRHRFETRSGASNGKADRDREVELD